MCITNKNNPNTPSVYFWVSEKVQLMTIYDIKFIYFSFSICFSVLLWTAVTQDRAHKLDYKSFALRAAARRPVE